MGSCIHISYCHYISSSNILEDMFSYFLVYVVYILQVSVLIMLCCHPDNSIEVNELVTPIHIVPEWYLLCYYVVLKCIPNINSGFMMLLICVLLIFQLCEVKNV